MVLGRQRASVEGRRVDEGNERGRDGAWTAGGRKRAEEGLSEEWRESKGGILRRALASIQYIHKQSHNAALAIDTLLLQMKNSEQVSIINYVYCLSGGRVPTKI